MPSRRHRGALRDRRRRARPAVRGRLGEPRSRCRSCRAVRRCARPGSGRATGPTRPRPAARARRSRPSSSTRCRARTAAASTPTRRTAPARSRSGGLPHSKPAARYMASTGWAVVEAVGETRGVGQQVPDPHRLGGRHGHRRLRRAAAEDALVAERLDVAVHRVLQLERALLVEHHRRHRRDRLGHRVDAPQRCRARPAGRPRGRDRRTSRRARYVRLAPPPAASRPGARRRRTARSADRCGPAAPRRTRPRRPRPLPAAPP